MQNPGASDSTDSSGGSHAAQADAEKAPGATTREAVAMAAAKEATTTVVAKEAMAAVVAKEVAVVTA
jgi:hypothetical protein